MHYTGMAAMRIDGRIDYDRNLVDRLRASSRSSRRPSRCGSPCVVRGRLRHSARRCIMGVAVSGMHYTGMFAMHVNITTDTCAEVPGVDVNWFLAPIVLFVLVVVIALASAVMAILGSASRPRPPRSAKDVAGEALRSATAGPVFGGGSNTTPAAPGTGQASRPAPPTVLPTLVGNAAADRCSRRCVGLPSTPRTWAPSPASASPPPPSPLPLSPPSPPPFPPSPLPPSLPLLSPSLPLPPPPSPRRAGTSLLETARPPRSRSLTLRPFPRVSVSRGRCCRQSGLRRSDSSAGRGPCRGGADAADKPPPPPPPPLPPPPEVAGAVWRMRSIRRQIELPLLALARQGGPPTPPASPPPPPIRNWAPPA